MERRQTPGIEIQTHLHAGTCNDIQQLAYQVRDIAWPWCEGTPYEVGCRIKSSHVMSYRQPEIATAAGC
jgi:hypothetical protein